MKNILRRLYATWLLLCFAITIILIAIPTAIFRYAIKDEVKRTTWILKGYRIWMKVLMFLVFCKITLKGRENFKKGENYIVICNHNSFFDILVSTPSVPGASKTLAKTELSKIPIFGLVYRSGSILVNRKSAASRTKSFLQMKETLDRGMHLILYPEGTRNKSQLPISPFYDGAFAMAVETQTPIIPALLFNTGKIIPGGRTLYAEPHAVQMHFLKPIPVDGLTTADIKSLKEKTFNLMTEYFVSHQQKKFEIHKP